VEATVEAWALTLEGRTDFVPRTLAAKPPELRLSVASTRVIACRSIFRQVRYDVWGSAIPPFPEEYRPTDARLLYVPPSNLIDHFAGVRARAGPARSFSRLS